MCVCVCVCVCVKNVTNISCFLKASAKGLDKKSVNSVKRRIIAMNSIMIVSHHDISFQVSMSSFLFKTPR